MVARCDDGGVSLFRRRKPAAVGPSGGQGWLVHERLVGRPIGAEPLSTDERLLLALGQLRDEVNNGGFSQYFSNTAGDGFADALEAATETGNTELSDLLGRAAAVLGAPVPADRAARQARLARLADDAVGLLDEIDRSYFELERSVDLDSAMDVLATRVQHGRISQEAVAD